MQAINDKENIANFYAKYANPQIENLDKRLLDIRHSLEAEFPDKNVDFYRFPWREEWSTGSNKASLEIPFENALAAQGIELIAPHRRNRKQKATQGVWSLRRYRHRWKIERLFAWLNAFKRTVVRWDRCHERFTAFIYLAFSMILLKRVIKEL